MIAAKPRQINLNSMALQLQNPYTPIRFIDALGNRSVWIAMGLSLYQQFTILYHCCLPNWWVIDVIIETEQKLCAHRMSGLNISKYRKLLENTISYEQRVQVSKQKEFSSIWIMWEMKTKTFRVFLPFFCSGRAEIKKGTFTVVTCNNFYWVCARDDLESWLNVLADAHVIRGDIIIYTLGNYYCFYRMMDMVRDSVKHSDSDKKGMYITYVLYIKKIPIRKRLFSFNKQRHVMTRW